VVRKPEDIPWRKILVITVLSLCWWVTVSAGWETHPAHILSDGNWILADPETEASFTSTIPSAGSSNVGGTASLTVHATLEINNDPVEDCFTKTAELLTTDPTIAEQINPYTFLVKKLKTLVEWKVTIEVFNESRTNTMRNVRVTDNFAGDLGVDYPPISVDPPGSSVILTKSGATEKVHLEWIIGNLAPRTKATLVLRVYTDINPGGQQEYTSPCWHYLNSGATVWVNGQSIKNTDPIKVKVLDGECPDGVTVTISASRIDWRVRKPGIFSAHAFDLSVQGDAIVAVTFSGFADLQRQNDIQTIATFYGTGNNNNPGNVISWYRAVNLNTVEYVVFPGGTISMWNKIEVLVCNSSCEYEDVGVITVSVTNQHF